MAQILHSIVDSPSVTIVRAEKREAMQAQLIDQQEQCSNDIFEHAQEQQETLGATLQNLRQENYWSCTDIENILSTLPKSRRLTAEYISHVEQDMYLPSLSALLVFSDIYKVNVDILLQKLSSTLSII